MPNFTAPVSQKNFFKGDKVQLKWNDNGTSLIVLAQTEVDKTGKSYYGETTLYLLSANGGFDSRIDLGQFLRPALVFELELTICRQRGPNPRRFVVAKVQQFRRGLRIHAGENRHLQLESSGSAHFPTWTTKYRAVLAPWSFRAGGWLWKSRRTDGHL